MVSLTIRCFVFILFCLSTAQVNSQICYDMLQYDKCSSNTACACFHMEGATDTGICGYEWLACSDLVPCEQTSNRCLQSDHICIRHPRCHDLPVCYPTSMTDRRICPRMTPTNTTVTTPIPTTTKPQQLVTPLRGSSVDIHPNARWQQNGVIVAGGNGAGIGINQLSGPWGLYVDDDQTVYIADRGNHRIVAWKSGATSGQVVAGGNGHGNGAHQLYDPVDVIVDKETDSLIIADYVNRRVVRWPRQNGTSGETIVSHIAGVGLTMDHSGSLYVTDEHNAQVRRYRRGESQGTIVAGGNGNGNNLNQLGGPQYVFVDRNNSVYVSDLLGHRVMQWMEDAKVGIIVAAGHEAGNDLKQLHYAQGVIVDQLGTVYVADKWNHRIMRWPKGATEGSVIVERNDQGSQLNQLNLPLGLSFDRQGNLYVVENGNARVQRFDIENNN